jgi:hypothetical protein
MNISACGHEWLSVPLVALTESDRLIFLINWISFLMMPGLIFSVFIRLQIRPRVAWWWMWFLSAGWCFVLQAGSVVNDSFAAVYALAAVDLALRAKEKNCLGDLWLSGLAAALLTGAKQPDIPLAALWLVAAWPARHLLRRQPLASWGILAVSLLVSILPISLLNWHYYGSWLPLEHVRLAGTEQFQLNPFWGVVGNMFCLPVQNLLPPFYEFIPPFYGYLIPFWNQEMAGFLQTPFGSHFLCFERFGHLSADTYRGISEGNAGVGLGVCLLFLAALYEGRRIQKLRGIPFGNDRQRFTSPLRLLPWFLLLVFMAKVGTFENARHAAPYYPFLFPLLLMSTSHEIAVRYRQWQKFGLGIMGLTCLLVIADPSRPLFPAQTLAAALKKMFPHNTLVLEEFRRYNCNVFRAIAPRRQWLRQTLPPDEKVIGFCAYTSNVDEPGIWLPYGLHQVHWISLDDSPEQLRRDGIRYVVIVQNVFDRMPGGFDGFIAMYNASVLATCLYGADPEEDPSPSRRKQAWLYLMKLN